MKKKSKKFQSMITSFFFVLMVCLSACKQESKDQEKAASLPPIEYSADYIMGKFDPVTHPDFEIIPIQYADRDSLFLRKDALADFIRMHDAAMKDSIKLVIRSATRNFKSQKNIWERKWNGTTILSDGINAATDISDPKERALKILEYSSMPSTSRHHWGTDIDLNAFNNKWFESGKGLKLYTWMLNNAHQFGFCQPYTEKGEERPDGYNEEKWHWSYTPVSRPLLEQAKSKLKNEMILGFLGHEQAVAIDVISKYVLGINSQCK